MPVSQSAARGISLIELLVVVAILGTMSAITLPSLSELSRKHQLRSAAGELRMIFLHTRVCAITSSRNTAVKFRLIGGAWHYTIFEDGDGDGVRNDDISAGIDLPVTPSRRVFGETGAVRIGLPPVEILDPDRGIVRPDESPVRFNSSTLCSFSQLGGGTSGSVYLTDGARGAAVVRVYGPSGRVRMAILKVPK